VRSFLTARALRDLPTLVLADYASDLLGALLQELDLPKLDVDAGFLRSDRCPLKAEALVTVRAVDWLVAGAFLDVLRSEPWRARRQVVDVDASTIA
jgi:hypothetical protein